MRQAHLLAPLAKTHAQFPFEQPRQGTLRGADLLRPVFQRLVQAGLVDQAVAQGLQALVAGQGHTDGTRVRAFQLVEDQFGQQRLARRLLARVQLFQRHDQLAQQVRHFQHLAVAARERRARGMDAQGAQAGFFQYRDGMLHVRRDPDGAHGRQHPAAVVGGNAQHAFERHGDLAPGVAVR